MLCTKRAGWGVLDKDPNPASATHNDIASCNTTSYVVFFLFYTATNLRQDKQLANRFLLKLFATITIKL